jgi:hypothetical protein
MRHGAALLLAAGLVGAACSGNAEPHGSPVLSQVFWIASGQRTLVWTFGADPPLAPTVPAAGQEVDFVFDRRLDGDRIEDTVTTNGVEMPVSKAIPPITVGWPGYSATTFGDQVLYNSEPIYGGATAYVFLQPSPVGFPSAATVTFSLDKTALTSAYGDQMTGPAQIGVATGPFSAAFGLPSGADGGSAAVPTSFLLPLEFSDRAGTTAALAPYVQVTAGGRDLPVTLAPNSSDPTVVYLSPASCLGGWPSEVPIGVTLLAGLPDAFGGALAATTSTTFVASGGAAASRDGGCPVPDAGAATDSGAATDARRADAASDARRADAGSD